ncbi:hypothetical protein B7P43_G05485 [Cryptotermes secundus]|uniref:Leucokinin n=1 Tax=Cryptotermes secundus TaxID=105785 RepID=A0A2J7R1H7_9NEOP|nr:uncharacterized protein LOC111864001 isoform X2 [Cryptotermes secundus]PNF34689.1 hypothetical protein B7P43_G05485 [Cryptotermes secundus]
MPLVRGQLLLLLAVMIVACSLRTGVRAQRMPQHSGQHDDREDKSASDQTSRAFARRLYNLQKLLEFDHGPLRGWTSADKGIALMDYFDDMEDRRDHVLTRLLQRYCLLPTQPSTWSVTGDLRLCEILGFSRPPCTGYSGSSSSGASPAGLSADREDATTPDIRASGSHLEHAHGKRTEDRQETAHQQHRGSDGRVQTEAEGAQAEVAQEVPKHNSGVRWSKKATPFSILGTARRRAFSSWGGKRVPGFHSWGGKRSISFPLLSKERSWGGTTDVPLTVPAFTTLGSKRLPAFSSWGGKRDPPAFIILTSRDGKTFDILDSKTEPERDIAFSISSGNGDPAVNSLASQHYPEFSISGKNYQAAPAFGASGSKRDSAFSDEGGKRGPAFYSWGGKRDSAFKPWGGKRKAAFSSWGGKKNLASSNWDVKTGPPFSSLDYKGEAEIPEWERKPEVTERGALLSVWDTKKFIDGNGHEKRHVSSWDGKRSMAKSEELEENHSGNGTVHSNENEDSRESDEREIKDANAQSSSAERHQRLLDDKIQLRTDNNNEDNGYSEGNMATSESEERKQKNQNTELSGQNAVDGREFDSAEFASFVTKRSVRPENGKNRVGKAFSPWGGKRSHAPASLFTILGSMHRPDSPGLLSDFWSKRGGYRNVFLASKKWDPSSAGAVFSSWGGKRPVKLAGQNTLKIPPQGTGRQFRRGADFYSWGGKR